MANIVARQVTDIVAETKTIYYFCNDLNYKFSFAEAIAPLNRACKGSFKSPTHPLPPSREVAQKIFLYNIIASN